MMVLLTVKLRHHGVQTHLSHIRIVLSLKSVKQS